MRRSTHLPTSATGAQQAQAAWERNGIRLSRRAAMGSSVAAAVGVLSGLALGQQEMPSGIPKEIQERMAKSREFAERMRNATSDEERSQVMTERQTWDRTRALDEIKLQLEVPDQEWAVIKPRVEAVYNQAHPQAQFGGGRNTRITNPVDRSRDELHGVLANKDTPADQIKVKLTALRAAQERSRQELTRARQSLRQLLTLRQEATLVLNGLLD